MRDKLKAFFKANGLYVGIGGGAVALCVVVAILFSLMTGGAGPALSTEGDASGVSDELSAPELSDPGTSSGTASESGDPTGTNGDSQTGNTSTGNVTTIKNPGSSQRDNRIGNTIYPADSSKNGYGVNNIVGVDDLGRTFTGGQSQNQKQVGMFFALGGQNAMGEPELAAGIYDCTKILAMENGLKILTDPSYYDPDISPDRQPHWWGEPIWGYYRARDPWVIQRQLQMLTIAGVDYVSIDVSNTLPESQLNFEDSQNNPMAALMKAICDLRKEGWAAPQVVFFTHSRSTQTVKQLYDRLYSKGLYKEAWYYYNGKPLIVGYQDIANDKAEAASRGDSTYNPTPNSSTITNFFSWKDAQWPQEKFYDNGLPWIEWTYPAKVHNDVINVTVASHPSVPISFSLTRGVVNWGRGWDPVAKKNVSANVAKGSFYQLTWDVALKSNASMVFIGEWNEWISMKQLWDGEYMLCDEVNQEFSRDIEPMKGGHGDNFYIQTILNVRKFKEVTGTLAGTKTTIDINKSANQWKNIATVYRSIGTSNIARDSYGAGYLEDGETPLVYKQAAARNNLQEIKAANDGENLYLYIRSEKAITEYDGKSSNWMNIFIGTGSVSQKGWKGYEYVINRSPKADGKTTVEKLSADGKGTSVGTAEYTVDGNVMQVKIPLKLLGGAGKELYFKVADDVAEPTDIMNYYVTGKTLPFGRLAYSYSLG